MNIFTIINNTVHDFIKQLNGNKYYLPLKGRTLTATFTLWKNYKEGYSIGLSLLHYKRMHIFQNDR